MSTAVGVLGSLLLPLSSSLSSTALSAALGVFSSPLVLPLPKPLLLLLLDELLDNDDSVTVKSFTFSRRLGCVIVNFGCCRIMFSHGFFRLLLLSLLLGRQQRNHSDTGVPLLLGDDKTSIALLLSSTVVSFHNGFNCTMMLQKDQEVSKENIFFCLPPPLVEFLPSNDVLSTSHFLLHFQLYLFCFTLYCTMTSRPIPMRNGDNETLSSVPLLWRCPTGKQKMLLARTKTTTSLPRGTTSLFVSRIFFVTKEPCFPSYQVVQYPVHNLCVPVDTVPILLIQLDFTVRYSYVPPVPVDVK